MLVALKELKWILTSSRTLLTVEEMKSIENK